MKLSTSLNESFQLLISYNDYCTITGQTAEETKPDWFDINQMLALSIIYKNMTQTHIFPANKQMFLHLKDQYKVLFAKSLAWQIKYITDNQDLYDNPTQYLTSHQLGTSATGPLNKTALEGLLNILSPKSRYYLEEMGWLYKSLTDRYELDQFYTDDVDPDDEYATQGYVNEKITETKDYVDTKDQEVKDYVDSKSVTFQEGEIPTGVEYKVASWATVGDSYWLIPGSSGFHWGEIIGNIENQEDLQQEFANKQDTLIAGENITIENNVISAIGGSSYTAGNGLQLSNNEFSIDEQVTATKTDLARKQDLLTTITGYDPTKIQCLYNNYGTLLWSEEKPQPHWWDDVSSLTTADIGTTREVEVNGTVHTVRLIGIDHDDLADGTGKAHTTWQFTNILSDENGYSLASFWQDTASEDDANFDFPNSSLRKALDGEGNGTANWFVKSETTWSSTYANKSVLDMLPTSLVSNLKEVSKQIAVKPSGTWVVNSYNTKLFILSYREMTADTSSYAEEEGTTYSYWAAHDTNADRIIQQVKGTTGAIISPTIVTSGAYSGYKYSYAGYDGSAADRGGYIWLRSPNTSRTDYACFVNNDGNLYYSYYVYSDVPGVAPCFCL